MHSFAVYAYPLTRRAAQEKIARSLIPHETRLAGSFYGKYFARSLSLHLLQRRPDEWRSLQSVSAARPLKNPAPVPDADPESDQPPTHSKPAQRKRKRGAQPADEIDAVFEAALGKKVKRGTLTSTEVAAVDGTQEKGKEKKEKGELGDVLSAIRSAPTDEKRHRRKKGAH